MVHRRLKPKESTQARAHQMLHTAAHGNEEGLHVSNHNLSSRILYLQRTIGNQAVIRLLEQQNAHPQPDTLSHTGDRPIQRQLGGEAGLMTLNQLFGALKLHYEGRIKYSEVRKFFKPQYTSVAAVAQAMGLKKKSTTKTENVEKKLEKVIQPVVPLLKPKKPTPTKTKVFTPTKKVLIPPKKKVLTSPKKKTPTRFKRKSRSVAKTTTHKVTYQKVVSVVAGVFEKKKKPNKGDFITALKAEFNDDLNTLVNDRAFVYDFQYAIRMQVEKSDDSEFLKKTQIYDVAEPTKSPSVKEGKPYTDLSKWTLRHYTNKGTNTDPPPFKDIKSAMSLSLMDGKKQERKSGHTGDTDWYRYGNTGNTFYLLCIDGELMSNQPFLKDAKWYVEIPFDQSSLWLSSDWLKEADIKGDALRGSGKAVHNALVTEIGLNGLLGHRYFIDLLKRAFNNLEVKVPGSVPVDEWKKKV